MAALLGIMLLLAAPAVAVWRQWEPYGAAAAALSGVMSACSFAAYGWDKRLAQRGRPRVPEIQLLVLDLLGGWPGGFLGQHWLRHKNAKTGYQFRFWGIVLLHQALALWVASG